VAQDVRDSLLEAFAATDRKEAGRLLDQALADAADPRLKGTVAEGFLAVARQYAEAVDAVDLTLRERYGKPVKEVRQTLEKLLGPRPGEPVPTLEMNQYGATRWDRALMLTDQLLWEEEWASAGEGRQLEMARRPREERFAGTELAGLFPLVRDNLDRMLLPEPTRYWNYFTDKSLSGYFFGGIGPEVLGTLAITVLTILMALPLGVIAAGYLVEASGGSQALSATVSVIRTCINTLAGVPSIVFGLFGLAFFVIYLPTVCPFMPSGTSILAGSMTLALLVLPVIIRASEEAIRAVPRAYKEAALSLGASRLRCFLTVTLPAAMPGILTGVILAMSRAAGETAPLLFTAAVAMKSDPFAISLSNPALVLSYTSYNIAVGDKIGAMVPHNQFGTVMTLILLVLILNVVAIVIRSRMSSKLRG
jgi:phosphate transport system permease protein